MQIHTLWFWSGFLTCSEVWYKAMQYAAVRAVAQIIVAILWMKHVSTCACLCSCVSKEVQEVNVCTAVYASVYMHICIHAYTCACMFTKRGLLAYVSITHWFTSDQEYLVVVEIRGAPCKISCHGDIRADGTTNEQCICNNAGCKEYEKYLR